jgi:hypothetical protein
VDVSVILYAACGASADLVGQVEAALEDLRARRGLTSEIILVTASPDGEAAEIDATRATVIRAGEISYGAAIRKGAAFAQGRYLVMVEADGGYQMADAEAMIEALLTGAGLCIGSRVGGQDGPPGWKQSFVAPLLAMMMRLLFGIEVSDFRCRFRALTRACYDRLHLSGADAELATEMVIKAALRGETIVERPVAFRSAGRARRRGLAGLRSAWSGLRYLFMFSPAWLFAAPAGSVGLFGLFILLAAGAEELENNLPLSHFGNYWVIFAASMVGLSHLAALLGVTAHLYGVREGYRKPGALVVVLARRVSLETMLAVGAVLAGAGLGVLIGVTAAWTRRHFNLAYSVYWPVVGTLLLTLGTQTALGGFLLAIVSGNKARFLAPSNIDHTPDAPVPAQAKVRRAPVRRGPLRPPIDARDHTFIVLAYKNSPFLSACLESLLAQSTPSSVIMTTSTPSDYLRDKAKMFGAPLLINPARANIAGDWDFGLRSAKTRFVTLAHQDDLYYPDFLEKSLELFDRCREGCLSFTGYQEIDDAGAAKSSKISKIKHLVQLSMIGSKERISGWRLRAILRFGNTLPCSTVTYDRERLGAFGFSQDFASNLDWDAWHRLSARNEVFLHTNERLVGRRHNALTATAGLIRDGRRQQEDLIMFRRFWPRPLSDAIAQVYRSGY